MIATSASKRSSLSEHVLSLDDMTDGRRIVCCFANRAVFGVKDAGIIVGGPRLLDGNLVVDIFDGKCCVFRFLADMGVVPYRSGEFSQSSYTLDARDFHPLRRSALPR